MREQLRGWGDAVASAALKRSTGIDGEYDSAYADLIAGPLLVEIKTWLCEPVEHRLDQVADAGSGEAWPRDGGVDAEPLQRPVRRRHEDG